MLVTFELLADSLRFKILEVELNIILYNYDSTFSCAVVKLLHLLSYAQYGKVQVQ